MYCSLIAPKVTNGAQLKDVKVDREIEKNPADVFISYAWQNSHEAVKKGTKSTPSSLGFLDPRTLIQFFKDNGINAWLDVDNVTSSSCLFGEITKGRQLTLK